MTEIPGIYNYLRIYSLTTCWKNDIFIILCFLIVHCDAIM